MADVTEHGDDRGRGVEAAAGAHGGGEVHGDEPHVSDRTYLIIAGVLAVLTAMEVMVFYVEALRPFLLAILMVLMVAKFALVVMFFMHLKFDSKVLSGVFGWGLATAVHPGPDGDLREVQRRRRGGLSRPHGAGPRDPAARDASAYTNRFTPMRSAASRTSGGSPCTSGSSHPSPRSLW